MQWRLFAALVCAALIAPASAVATTPAEEIEQIRSEIARVERLLAERNAQNWGRAQERLSMIRDRLGTLSARLETEEREGGERRRRTENAKVEEESRRPMVNRQFEELRVRVADEVNDPRRTMQLKPALADNWFSTDQVRTLLELYRRDADRLAALQLLAPRISDRENRMRLQEAFSRRADRDKALAILAQ